MVVLECTVVIKSPAGMEITVQIVQPKPNSLTDKNTITDTNPTTPDHHFLSSGKQLHPITSPDQVSPVPKKSRRTRTGTEGRDLITNTERRDFIISMSRDTTETIEKQTFTLQSFQLSSQGKKVICTAE